MDMILTEEYLVNTLFKLQDKNYKAFNCKLIPSVDPCTVIGVRAPELRKLAAKISKEYDTEDFLRDLPHKYFEENNIHAFLIENNKNYDRVIELLDLFLPYVDNWATCDSMRPKIFKKNKDKLYMKIKAWISSGETYTVRFAVGMLMTHYLDENFKPEYLSLVAGIVSDEYYVNMMLAWYFATALAKQYDAVIPYLEENRLSQWVHNKTIQKAIESYRITEVQKQYLLSLKIK